jgi:hypothetical protein
MDVCLLCLFVLCSQRPLRPADHSSRGVLPSVSHSVIKHKNNSLHQHWNCPYRASRYNKSLFSNKCTSFWCSVFLTYTVTVLLPRLVSVQFAPSSGFCSVQTHEAGANSTETCRGNINITTYVAAPILGLVEEVRIKKVFVYKTCLQGQ